MAKKKSKAFPKPKTDTPHGARIVALRRQLIVHSHLYYRMGESLISDAEFDSRAYELKDLQEKHGWQYNFHDKLFKDWDGSTAYHLLPLGAEYHSLATQLIAHHAKILGSKG